MNITISDNINLIRIAIQDLEAVQSVIITAEDGPQYTHEHEILSVTSRALTPIISDLKDAVDSIDEENRFV